MAIDAKNALEQNPLTMSGKVFQSGKVLCTVNDIGLHGVGE